MGEVIPQRSIVTARKAFCGYCKREQRGIFFPTSIVRPSTCWRRLKQWEEEEVWLKARRTLLGTLDEKGSLFKEFTFSDRFRLQFRIEAFNTANTPQFKTAGNLNFENATSFCKIT